MSNYLDTNIYIYIYIYIYIKKGILAQDFYNDSTQTQPNLHPLSLISIPNSYFTIFKASNQTSYICTFRFLVSSDIQHL